MAGFEVTPEGQCISGDIEDLESIPVVVAPLQLQL